MSRNAAVMQYTKFAYTDELTRRRITNTAIPNPGRFEEEWAKFDLASMNMRGKEDLQETVLIVMNMKPESMISGKLLRRTALALFGSEEVKIKQGEEEDKSAGRLIIPKFPDGTMNEEQGPSSLGKNQKRDDKEGENHRRSEEPTQQDPDQAAKDDNKASTGGISSLDFNFLENFEVETGTLKRMTEPAEDETSTLEPPSAFLDANQKLPESSSPGNSITIAKKVLMESSRRKRIEGTAGIFSW